MTAPRRVQRTISAAVRPPPCVVVLTGPPGAGKSSVATALHDALGDAGESTALIEVDELERCYPPLDEERVLTHVAMLCASFRAGGYGLLLLTATVEEDGYGERLLQAADPGQRLVVRLEARRPLWNVACARASPRAGPGSKRWSSPPGGWP